MPSAERRAAAFLDRDGVINQDLGHVYRVADFHLLPGVIEAVQLLAAAGLALVVVTNQAGIAKGLYTEADYKRLTTHLRDRLAHAGVVLAGVYHCPHHPQAVVPALRRDCDCRKPRPGMLQRAAAELSLDLGRSLMVGDKPGDVLAGRAAGVDSNVLVRSGHALTAAEARAADGCFDDLLAAARWFTAARPPLRWGALG